MSSLPSSSPPSLIITLPSHPHLLIFLSLILLYALLFQDYQEVDDSPPSRFPFTLTLLPPPGDPPLTPHPYTPPPRPRPQSSLVWS